MEARADKLSLFDLLSSDRLDNPYPFYQMLRMEAPVHWDPMMRSWILTRYSDIFNALQDSRLSEERVAPFLDQLTPKQRDAMKPLAQVLSRMMLFLDPPNHTRLRGTVIRAFTPKIVKNLHARIEQAAHDLLDTAQSSGQFDVIRDFSVPLSAEIIADLLDVPVADRKKFVNWTSVLKGFFGQSSEEVIKVADLKIFFNNVLQKKAAARNEGILGELFNAHDDGLLNFDELFGIYVLLFDAGQVTTANLIGNGFLALLRNPDQLIMLQRDVSLMPTAVSELLRYDGPVQFTSRIAKEDLIIGGKTIAKGQNVVLMLAAANHDPDQFPNPDQLNITRKENRHLSFGYGIHYCLGASLALLEAQIAISTLLSRLKNPRLSGTPRWQANLNFRFLESFPITFDHGCPVKRLR